MLPDNSKKRIPLMLFLIGIVLITMSTGSEGAGKETREIKLSAHGFDPSLKGGGNYQIVQFEGPIRDEWKQELEDSGARIIGYVPDNALLIKYHGVPVHPSIVRSGDFVLEYKVSPRLSNMNGTVTLNVITFEKNDSLVEQISLLGGEVDPLGDRLRVTIDASRILEIAALEDVEWIEEYVPPRLLNDVSAGIIGAGTVWADPGLDGTGQIIAVDDTGLDTGNLATMHDDFKGRIQAHFGYGRPSIGTDAGQTKTWSDPAGHGTHVAGSVLGNGSRSGGTIKGMAYNATLVFQSILSGFDSQGNPLLGGLGVGINQIYLDSYNQGARIQSNSWGAVASGAYTSYAVDVDTFAWNHKDFLILFAAGNEGIDSNADGIVDLDSLSSPGTAKNVITVGASENSRPAIISTYGGSWLFDYPSHPINSDLIADDSNGMVAFSSRGPTNDGRIKPDVVAPGTWILSTKSSLANILNYWGFYNEYYAYDGGTSMSTPLTAGAAALVRQFYVNSGIYPSSALIKATLINTATNMTGQYSSPEKDVTGQPDNNQGWGRVNLSKLTENRVYFDNNTGLNTSEFYETSVTIDGSKTFIATLVWTDYPGLPAASKELVNDLDLIVTDPAGQQFYGNDFTAPYNSSNDASNNVEGVIIRDPIAGEYKVNVSAKNVPMGPQPFAVVISGIGEKLTITANPTIYPNGQTAAKNGDAITLGATVTSSKGVKNVTVNANDINSTLGEVILEKSTGDSYLNSSVVVNASDGVYKLNVTAYDNSSNKENSTQLAVIVDNTDPDISPNPVKYEKGSAARNNTVIIINVTASDNLFLKNVSADVSSVNASGKVELVNASGFWTYALIVRGQDGNHTINVTAYDGAMNINRTEFNITIDNSPPAITNITHNATVSLDAGSAVRVDMQGEAWETANFTIQGVVSNATMNEITGGNYSANYTVTGNIEVNNAVLTGYLTDAVGNVNSSAASQGIDIDSRAPVITRNSPANNSVIRSGTVIDLTVSDLNLDNVEYNINSGANITLPAPYDISTTGWAGGTYIIRVYANDTIQHSVSSLYVFTIDDTPPLLTILSPAEGTSTESDSITVSGFTESGAAVRVNGSVTGLNSTGYFNISVGLSLGSNRIFINATDALNNLNSTSRNVTRISPSSGGGVSPGGGGGGSGGGGGGGSPENYSNLVMIEKYDLVIYKDKMTSYKFSDTRNPVLTVDITGNVNAGEIRTSVDVLKGKSVIAQIAAPEIIYKYLNIWVGTSGFAVPEHIKDAVIKFKVNNSWIIENGLDSSEIKMSRWNGIEWLILETSMKSEDSKYTYLEAKTNAFSPFAISGIRSVPAQATQVSTPVPTPKAEVTSETPEVPEPEATKAPGFEAVLGAVTLCAVYLFGRRR